MDLNETDQMLYEAMQHLAWFVWRCGNGHVRSNRTRHKYEEIIAKYEKATKRKVDVPQELKDIAE
jgi:hypothetical protein